MEVVVAPADGPLDAGQPLTDARDGPPQSSNNGLSPSRPVSTRTPPVDHGTVPKLSEPAAGLDRANVEQRPWARASLPAR